MEIALTPVDAPRSTAVGERILDAAARLFYENGITATGVDLVVNEAGTTKRTLYQRFGSKDSLVAAYLQRRAHLWQRRLLDALMDAQPSEGLDTVYDQARAWAADNGRGCAFVNAWAELGPRHDQAVAVIRAEKEWMLSLFTQVAGNNPQRGEALHLIYEGAQSSSAIRQDLAPLETARAASKAILGP